MTWNNVEDAFKDLDQKEFSFFATALGAYLRSLMSEGFSRREAMRLVETYAKFIYDMSIEEFISQKREEEENRINRELDEDDDVDLNDEL